MLAGAARLIGSDAMAARAVRYAVVGALNSAVYAGVTALLVSGLGVAPVPASVAGYCIAVPFGFVGHRGFSFRSHGHWTGEALRFAVTQTLNLAVTVAAMHGAVTVLRASYVWGMIATVVLVPIASFLMMHLWVFRREAA